MNGEKAGNSRHWILDVISPMTIHLVGLVAIYLFTLVFKTRSNLLRKVMAISLFNIVIFLGFLKTSTDENLYRVLRTQRTPSIKDIQVGLDRLELTLDEETVSELENKLTGKTSSYFLKGNIASRRS